MMKILPIQCRRLFSVLAGFLIVMLCPNMWGEALPPGSQDAFWSAMSKHKYREAGKNIEQLLAASPRNQAYKFQKAEWLWQSQNPAAAIRWLSKEEPFLQKDEIVNFFNKMLPKLSEYDWTSFYISVLTSSHSRAGIRAPVMMALNAWTVRQFKSRSFMQHPRNAFNIIDATILSRAFSSMDDARQPFLVFKDRLLNHFKTYPIALQFELAVLVDKYVSSDQAQPYFQIILNHKSKDKNAGVWKAKTYMRQKKYLQAGTIAEAGLKKDPDSYPLLLIKGELMESAAQRDFLSAIKVYNHALRLYPTDEEAFNVKMRALMDLGANSLVMEKLTQNSQSDPVLLQRARGNIAMNYIRWDEPREAERSMALKEKSKKKDYKRARKFKIALDPAAVSVENNRSRWDSILVLFQKDQFQDVIDQYQDALADGLDVPVWVLKAVADAYLFKHQPEEAFLIYMVILDADPDSFDTKIALYFTLIDLGMYDEADRLVESMDHFEPVQVMERGILRDNSHKSDIAYNKVWLLMYQDRLKKAQKIGEQFFLRAPGDIQLRSVMAHLSLWRGWPRKALREFRVIRTMSPLFVAGGIGYARALYDNTHKKEARALLSSLANQYPRNRHVARARHLMEVDDMGLLTIHAYYTREFPGEDEFWLSMRVDQPVSDRHTLFAELIRRETTRREGNDLTQRFYAGDIYQPNNTWKLTNALTGDFDTGRRLGWISEVAWTPDDYWTHTFHYDSRTIDVPLRSRAEGIDVSDYQFSTLYRHSESFNTGASVDFRDFEDGNANWNYSWTTDSAVKTYAYWKWRFGTQLDYSTYSQQDVGYYSPEGVYDFYLIPNVEHVWFKRYEKGLIDRFFVGIGQQWEKSFGAANIGYLLYELEYQHSDTANFTLGTAYSLKSYDGQDMNALNCYATVKKRF